MPPSVLSCDGAQAKARALGVISQGEAYNPEKHARGLEAAVLHAGGWGSAQMLARRALMFRDGAGDGTRR